MGDTSQLLDILFKPSKLDYLKNLEENNDTDFLIDLHNNVILPNLKGVLPSTSLFLREDIFSKYLDKIIFDAFTHYGNQMCLFKSVFYTDYFITIDFVDFIYKIPNILLSTINKCKLNPSVRFYVIPLRLNLTYKDAHSNVVIVDNLYKTIEFFEPHGSTFMITAPKPYNIENHVKILLSRLFPIRAQYYKYQNVQNNCPIGLQSQQNIINPQSGHCLAWSLLFIHVRINNLFLSPNYIIDYFNKNFTPIDLDTYMKRYIALLEVTTFNVHTKTLPNFKYTLNLSQPEKLQITERIVSLTQQYLLELNSEKDKRILNKIFEELISYHKFPNFNEIFFKAVNDFIEESQQLDTNSISQSGTENILDDIFLTKRKLSDSDIENSKDKKFKTDSKSPLSLLFEEMDQHRLSDNKTDALSTTLSEAFSTTSSDYEDDDEDELRSLYEQFK
jgi:hypothetical protein